MGRAILKYGRKSQLMEVAIKYGDEKFKFNLYEELSMNEDNLDVEIKNQPRAYAFLTMLHKRLIKYTADKEATMDRSYARAYMKAREEKDALSGRQRPKEDAKELARLNKLYIKCQKDYFKAREDLGIIETCVKGFEQRSFLLQTLSANRRNER